MNRRQFIAAATGVLLNLQRQSATRAAASPRPHIVLFLSDDQSWHDCGPYGAADVRTPNVDRLAGQSMVFKLAFAASPTCSPSRSAMYTGLYPLRNGGHANHSQIRKDLHTLPVYLQELGYRVVIAGKTHIGPRSAFPFEFRKDTNVNGGKAQDNWPDLDTAAVDRILEEHDRNQPLCLLVCAHQPHVYWPANETYDPAKIQLPPYLADTPETRALRCRYYTDVSWMDRQLGDVLTSLEKHGYVDNTLFIYAADQGAQWPFAKWNLYDAGIRVPLLVRWLGKVAPASRTDAMVSLVDLLPTMIEAAGGKPPKDLDGRSFLPVLLGRKEQHTDAVFAAHTGDGKMNRSPMRCIRTRQYKYILNLRPETPFTCHISEGVANDGRSAWTSWEERAKMDPKVARLVERYRRRPAEELYDVTRDPYEQTNLAEDPTYADLLAELREKLKQWRTQQGEDLNKVPMPEDTTLGGFPYAN